VLDGLCDGHSFLLECYPNDYKGFCQLDADLQATRVVIPASEPPTD
jgi:hypothetical protein